MYTSSGSNIALGKGRARTITNVARKTTKVECLLPLGAIARARVFITRLDGGIKNAYTSKVLDYYSNDDVSYIVLFSKRNTALAQRP